MALCRCETPDIVRTTAKGTPAERNHCSCGGMVVERLREAGVLSDV